MFCFVIGGVACDDADVGGGDGGAMDVIKRAVAVMTVVMTEVVVVVVW